MKQAINTLRYIHIYLAALMAGLIGLCGCSSAEAEAVRTTPAEQAQLLMPEASGVTVYAGEGVTLDASNTDQGYIMVKSAESDARRKTRVEKDEGAYNYDQPLDDQYETYPLQMGSGEYGVQVLEQVEGAMYSRVFQKKLSVSLTSEETPYLYPNQFVSYEESDEAVKKSRELARGLTDEAEIADSIYRFVADKIDYDYDKAAAVSAGYLPVPDETLETRKGICFDYSALLATMLRAQGIPTKLVIGYVAPDNLYHAWNQAYLHGTWKFYDATLDGEGRKEADYTGERTY